jgi:hypothetical protein
MDEAMNTAALPDFQWNEYLQKKNFKGQCHKIPLSSMAISKYDYVPCQDSSI